jgi:hypothetical protein
LGTIIRWLILSLLFILPREALPQPQREAEHESFDSIVPPVLPQGWTSSRFRQPPADDFAAVSSAARSQPNAALAVNATIGQWLLSPSWDWAGLLPEKLQFWTRRSSTFGARLIVEASLDGGVTFPIRLGDTLDAGEPSVYALHEVPLPAPLASGTPARCRWRVLPEGTGTTGTLRIDDIAVTGRPSAGSDSTGIPVIVLNEIMYAPAAGEPEWVEILNEGKDAVELGRWQISDAAFGSKHRLSSLPLPPGGFALLTRDSAGLAESRGMIHCPVIQVPGFPSLNNTGDAVLLYDDAGTTKDSVVYLPAWGGTDGRSLERIDPQVPSSEAGTWGVCTDSSGATPGRGNSIRKLPRDLALVRAVSRVEGGRIEVAVCVRNAGSSPCPGVHVVLLPEPLAGAPSQSFPLAAADGGWLGRGDSVVLTLYLDHPPPGIFRGTVQIVDSLDLRLRNNTEQVIAAVPFPPGALVINEIMAHPAPGGAEYVELLNWGSSEVNAGSWWIHDGRVSADREPRGVIPSCPVAPGGYLLVGVDSALLTLYPEARLAGRSIVLRREALSLNDDGDDIVLHDPSGSIVDSVAYRASWHNPSVADPAGRSLERIAPLMSSSDARSWTSSASRTGGTPGARNSVFAGSLPPKSRLACSPNPFSPDGDGFNDAAILRYAIPAEAATVSITLYDVRGRKVRRLADHEPSGAEGMIAWDGRDDTGVRAPVGMYIILLQAASGGGAELFEARAVVVLALPL